MFKSPRLFSAIAGLCALFFLQGVHAIAPQCVSTSAQLQSALTAAQNDNQQNYIGLVTGTYTLSGSLHVSIGDKYGLVIEGGYASGCGSLPIATPDLTIITGANVAGTNVTLSTTGGDLTIRNLTFTALKPTAGTDAIYILDDNASDHLIIENVAIHHNNVQGINDNIAAIYPYGGLLMVDNVVHDNGNAAATVSVSSIYPGSPLAILNNTIANNVSSGLSLSLALVDIPPALFNNILWNNSGSDLRLAGTHPLAMNNSWQTQFFDANSGLGAGSANNDNSNPQLTTNFQLPITSPAIESGLPAPMLLPLTDAGENLRVFGGAPDRGAYETSASGQAYFLVNNTSDKTQADDSTITCQPSKPCTLREAIFRANSAGPSQIAFHLASDCSTPQFIELLSPLPPITVPLWINGYSEPGSSASTTNGANGIVESNAVICVNVFGAPTTPQVANAFSVASNAPSNVHLEVSGLQIFGFATAIDLAGGNGHWIHGNDFFGPFVYNGIGVKVEGGAATVVGGPLDTDPNFLSSSAGSAGVVISSTSTTYNTIYGNSIGGDPTGASTIYGNANAGVLVDNTYSNIVQKNWIGHNGGDGIRLNGAVYTLIQTNTIGSSILQSGNAGAGVHAVGGAYSNWIGMTDVQGTNGGNAMVNNALAGVLIDADAGRYNQTVGNYIQSTQGLAIDLAAIGPTINSGPENSGGPNDLIHKPILTSADAAKAGPTVNVQGTINTSPNDVRFVSIYSNYECGDANFPLGTFQLTANASGIITFNLSVPSPAFGPAYITATATDNTGGTSDTSEISNCKKVSPSDDIFNDAFDAY